MLYNNVHMKIIVHFVIILQYDTPYLSYLSTNVIMTTTYVNKDIEHFILN